MKMAVWGLTETMTMGLLRRQPEHETVLFMLICAHFCSTVRLHVALW